MNEQELQDAIVETANLLGWRVFHTRPARSEKGWRTAVSYQGKGFPDLCMVRDRLLFAEIKVKKNTLSDEQRAWRDQIAVCGVEWHLWDETAWKTGMVEDTLRREVLR